LALRRRVPRILDVDRVVCQDRQSPSESGQRWVMGEQIGQEAEQVVRLVDRQAPLFQQGLQVLLDALLTMEANEVMKRGLSAVESGGAAEVVLRLAHPRGRRPLHRGLSLS
jgi:hypothetical protein